MSNSLIEEIVASRENVRLLGLSTLRDLAFLSLEVLAEKQVASGDEGSIGAAEGVLKMRRKLMRVIARYDAPPRSLASAPTA